MNCAYDLISNFPTAHTHETRSGPRPPMLLTNSTNQRHQRPQSHEVCNGQWRDYRLFADAPQSSETPVTETLGSRTRLATFKILGHVSFRKGCARHNVPHNSANGRSWRPGSCLLILKQHPGHNHCHSRRGALKHQRPQTKSSESPHLRAEG